MKDYTDRILSEGHFFRKFHSNYRGMELDWHRDHNDRVIRVIKGTGWKCQIDNQLPESLQKGQIIRIPARTFHRLFAGQGPLVIEVVEGKKKKKADGSRSVKMGADKNPDVTRMDFLPDKVLKKIAKKKKTDEAKLTPGYKAGRSAGDQAKLKKLIDRYNKAKKTPGKADDLAAIRARDNFEKTQKKSGRKSKHNYKNERLTQKDIEDLINELNYEMKKDMLERKISSKVDKALKKKAKDRNAPVGALKAIYKKGVGAFYSSGSRSGQNPHSWAMGRVNSVLRGGKARSVDKAQWKQIQKHRKKKRKKK